MAPLSASKNFIIFDIKVFDSSVFLIFVFNISHNSIVADIFSLKEDSSAIITAAWLVLKGPYRHIKSDKDYKKPCNLMRSRT